MGDARCMPRRHLNHAGGKIARVSTTIQGDQTTRSAAMLVLPMMLWVERTGTLLEMQVITLITCLLICFLPLVILSGLLPFLLPCLLPVLTVHLPMQQDESERKQVLTDHQQTSSSTAFAHIGLEYALLSNQQSCQPGS